MSDNLLFDIAHEDDIASIESLVNSAYRGDSSKAGWTTEADFLDGIRVDASTVKEMIDKPDAVILTCRQATRGLVGCVYLEKQENGRMYLGMLTVAPLLQANGIGRKLLERSESYAKENGCSQMLMTVITIRKELIEWYERRGYRRTEQVRPFPNNPKFGIPKQPLEFVVMDKSIYL